MKRFFLIIILILAFASVFASAFPDGLEFVAEKLGFLGYEVKGFSFFGDYSLGFFGGGALSIFASGLLGVFVIISIFAVVSVFVKKKG